MRRVLLAARARRDLAETIALIAHDDPNAAERLLRRVEAAAERPAAFPEMGPARGVAGVRIFAVSRTPFALVYRHDAETVTILRVWHGARGWPPAS